MHRYTFKKLFKCSGPAILPVIHVLDLVQTQRNIKTAIEEGASGVFLINHDFHVERFLPIIRSTRELFPSLWLGVNFLAVTGKDAFPILGSLKQDGISVDAYWADDARIDESRGSEEQSEPQQILDTREVSGWHGIYFGGVAFKKQREVAPQEFSAAARIATDFVDVVTTSGKATGKQTPTDKVEAFRAGLGDNALCIASGATPENIGLYRDHVDAILVATGINRDGDFYNIDRLKLRRLLAKARPVSPVSKENRNARNYMSLMAPRSRSEKYAWLDPSSAYINAQSFSTILDDLLRPFEDDEIDVVAGIDAAGFVLAGAMAVRLGKGVLTLRKGGKTPVDYDTVPMMNYSGKTQHLEMRKPAFAAKTRVLLVDQWIETGGTMKAGTELIERQGGIVAGIAVVCVEENAATREMREKYKVSSCVLPGTDLQALCNSQTLTSFKGYQPVHSFPQADYSE